jgi:TonB family protein
MQEQALGARARPFAQYLTAMHKQIHKGFTVGFLADIDARHDPAYADNTLWTQLAIVVNGDGTLERAQVVHASGVQSFDAAALASVKAAAPFPAPPSTIESSDGRVYLDWRFYRDDVRGCSTIGVAPHIFTFLGGKAEEPRK